MQQEGNLNHQKEEISVILLKKNIVENVEDN